MDSSEETDDLVFLSEGLDALDRLYDGHSNAVDVEALLRVIGLALHDRALGIKILTTADELRAEIRAAFPSIVDPSQAASVTERVRVPISRAWQALS